MLKRFTSSLQRCDSVRAPACVPDGMRVYAIGDIHGRADLLEELLEQIRRDRTGHGGRCRIIFLGDYVNRGPSSRQVLDRLSAMAQASDEHAFLMGNHEEILLRIIDGAPALVRLFLKMGGRETLLSYGMTPAQYDAATLAQIADFLQAAVPTRAHACPAGRLSVRSCRHRCRQRSARTGSEPHPMDKGRLCRPGCRL